MSRYSITIDHIPTLSSVRKLTLSEMNGKLRSLPIVWNGIKLDDSFYYAPGWDGWRKIIDYIKPKVPPYLIDKFDCETTADWFRVKVAEIFGINTCASVEGWADVGRGYPERHGWSVFYESEGDSFYQLEPRNGMVMDIDDGKYVPDEIIMR